MSQPTIIRGEGEIIVSWSMTKPFHYTKSVSIIPPFHTTRI
jgi:hypothetical protein